MKTIEDFNFSDIFLPKPSLTEQLVCIKDMGFVYTNVPHLVVHHSPDGFQFGYAGSGPADLALNICQYVLQKEKIVSNPVKCFKGECYSEAWKMHQAFKFRFLTRMRPVDSQSIYEQYSVPYAGIRNFILEEVAIMHGKLAEHRKITDDIPTHRIGEFNDGLS